MMLRVVLGCEIPLNFPISSVPPFDRINLTSYFYFEFALLFYSYSYRSTPALIFFKVYLAIYSSQVGV